MSGVYRGPTIPDLLHNEIIILSSLHKISYLMENFKELQKFPNLNFNNKTMFET